MHSKYVEINGHYVENDTAPYILDADVLVCEAKIFLFLVITRGTVSFETHLIIFKYFAA